MPAPGENGVVINWPTPVRLSTTGSAAAGHYL